MKNDFDFQDNLRKSFDASIQARVRQLVTAHIAGGPAREREALEIWKMHPNALTRRCEIQYRRGVLGTAFSFDFSDEVFLSKPFDPIKSKMIGERSPDAE